MKQKKIIKAVLFTSIVAMSFTGCSFNSKPRTASDLVSKYLSLKDSKNYLADYDIDIKLKAQIPNFDMNIPLNVKAITKTDGNDSYISAKAEISALGEIKNINFEMYQNGTQIYGHESDSSDWEMIDLTDSAEGTEYIKQFNELTNNQLNPDMFADADLNIVGSQNSDVRYIVSIPLDKMWDYSLNQNQEVKKQWDSLLDEYSEYFNREDFYEQLTNNTMNYYFDKNYYLVSIKLNDFDYQINIDYDGEQASIGLQLDLNVDYSDYGKITKSNVIVPDEIASAAVNETLDNSIENELPTSIITPDIVNTFPDTDEQLDTIESIENTNSTNNTNTKINNDYFGAYNGHSISIGSNDWSIFSNDGWKFDNEDGAYIFMSAINDKFENAEMYVYDATWDNGITSSDIINHGFYSYSINCMYMDKNQERPNMTFNGITFGASLDELLSAYGEPDKINDMSYSTEYVYVVSQDSINNIELQFYIANDGSGLQKIEITYF